ncbi:hypothetical protein BD779DRAFT_1521715 [Infundibulicybe gibba]|nr:hypothetical protein BD779DRAFT_1521715 [Infundibulicybe gibba]
MWSKISNALKPRQVHDTEEIANATSGEVLSKVFEQHPNMSVFHPAPSPPPSPSRNGHKTGTGSRRGGMFKRMSKVPAPEGRDDNDTGSMDIGSMRSISLPKKTKAAFSADSISRGSGDISRPSLSKPSKRPSLDMLRLTLDPSSSRALAETAHEPLTPGTGSVRSILRDPKTPGTGRSVRFFSRDAYEAGSLEESTDAGHGPTLHSHAEENHQSQKELEPSFMDRIHSSSSDSSSSALSRSLTHHKSRPSVADIFSLNPQPSPLEKSTLDPIPPPNFGGSRLLDDASHAKFLDMDTSMDMSLSVIPPGLGLPMNLLEQEMELEFQSSNAERATSTPFQNGKGKGRPQQSDIEKPLPPIEIQGPVVDETIFHSQEKSPRLPEALRSSPLYERSQSFSFGQTVFFSMNASDGPMNRNGKDDSLDAAYPSSSMHINSSDDMAPPSPPPKHEVAKNRNRALSDSVFSSLSPAAPIISGQHTKSSSLQNPRTSFAPESDINDESTSLILPPPPIPDPFGAESRTYYTPQTLIPITPPQPPPTQHIRHTSKEQAALISLQTQLSLQTELCSQYSQDLQARDELVTMLTSQLTSLQTQDKERRVVLKKWKKKVLELERTVRNLEEECEGGRRERGERSLMDEASGEALRCLQARIEKSESEKGRLSRRVEELEHQLTQRDAADQDTAAAARAKELDEQLREREAELQERYEELEDREAEVRELRRELGERDEREGMLREGIKEARDVMEMMGNVSGVLDEEEVRRLVSGGRTQAQTDRVEQFQRQEEERELQMREQKEEWDIQMQESQEHWDEEKTKMLTRIDALNTELGDKEQELAVMKDEVEAQWAGAERASEKIMALEKELQESEQEQETLKMELEKLQSEVEEEQGIRDELEDQLRAEQEQVECLTSALQEREDRLSTLDQEQQFAVDNAARFEERLRQRELDLQSSTQRLISLDSEAEELRSELSTIQRTHAHALAEQTRSLETAQHELQVARSDMETAVRAKAQIDVELAAAQDRVASFKDEVSVLKKTIGELKKESADKEVKIMQAGKLREKDREDLVGLNIALDSKQQELELLKRRIGVRGTAGSTPAQSSKVASRHRRDSSIFTTPSIPSRPSSVMSDIATTKERKISGDAMSLSSARAQALGRSTRINAATPTPTVASISKPTRGIEGSMGPPPSKPRVSMAGTPTPSGRVSSLARSFSARALTDSNTTPHRRVSSASGDVKPTKLVIAKPSSTALSQLDEKENHTAGHKTPAPVRKIPIPA